MSERDQEKAESVVAFSITNKTKSTIDLSFEPWGMDYHIQPGQTFTLRIVPPQEPPQIVLNHDGWISIWCDGWASIFDGDVEIHDYLPTVYDVEHAEEHAALVSESIARRMEEFEAYKAAHPEEVRAALDRLTQAMRQGRHPTSKELEGFSAELVAVFISTGTIVM